MLATSGRPTMSRARPTCTTSGRSAPTPVWMLAVIDAARSGGNFASAAGSRQADSRAPGTPSACSASTISRLVAHLMNSHRGSRRERPEPGPVADQGGGRVDEVAIHRVGVDGEHRLALREDRRDLLEAHIGRADRACLAQQPAVVLVRGDRLRGADAGVLIDGEGAAERVQVAGEHAHRGGPLATADEAILAGHRVVQSYRRLEQRRQGGGWPSVRYQVAPVVEGRPLGDHGYAEDLASHRG